MPRGIKAKHTTEVSPEKSAMEITEMLGHIGAKKIQLEYDDDRNLIGMRFFVNLGEKEIPFRLPIRWEPIFQYLRDEKVSNGHENLFAEDWEEKLEAQARRSAWRLAQDWLKSQLAFIEFGVRRPEELFLADMVVKDDRTLGDLFADGDLPRMIEGS